MAVRKGIFIWYEDSEQFGLLHDAQLGQLIRALIDYSQKGVRPELEDPAVAMAFSFMASRDDRDGLKYESICEKRREAGKKGGRPKKANAFSDNQKVSEESKEKQKKPSSTPALTSTPASVEPNWNPSGTQSEPQDRIGESRIIFPSIAPQQGDGEDAQGESLMVESACGTSSEKLVNPSMTLCAKHFADFWAAYPKKVGKGAAENAFKKLKPTAELFTKMLDAISRQRSSDQWRRDNGRFIPNPSTWLNQRRWEDELGYGAGMAPNYYEETEGSL